MLCEQKVSVYAALGGRTRRIRTADLYHVKADWPHQDTHGRCQTGTSKAIDQLAFFRYLDAAKSGWSVVAR